MAIKLESMSYEEFGRLRFLDFFPRTEDYWRYEGKQSGIGLCWSDGYRFTCFCSPLDREDQTAEIGIDLSQDECPETSAHSLLDYLGAPLRKGMPLAKVKAILGAPVSETALTLDYVFGDRWPYYMRCALHEERGLYDIWICRKDLADKENSL